jgi:hypothetical protein
MDLDVLLQAACLGGQERPQRASLTGWGVDLLCG